VTPANLELHLEQTGDSRFDGILGGGIPAQSVVVVAGEPGSGKTVLTLQLLFKAAREGKNCLYVTTLSEPAIKLIRYMQFFHFFDPDLLDERILLADLGGAVRESPERTITELSMLVQQHEPSLIAIDSFKAIADLMPDPRAMRTFVYDLATQTALWGATTFLLGEYGAHDFSRRPEFAVADGVVYLGSQKRELTSLRELEIMKMRGMSYVSGRHFFEIDRRGFFVYPRVRSPKPRAMQATASPPERVATGVTGLDPILDGGLPKLSNTVIQGATGTGKTMFSLQYLLEGARRGERGVLFTLEETPDQLRTIAAGFGWDLPALEREHLLTIDYTSPVELSTDRYLQQARDFVERARVTRVVFDSLTSMALGVPSERRFKELVYAMGKHMRADGVTLLMTIEAQQRVGVNQVSGHGVSFVADNLIQLHYLDAGGRLERGLSVIKVRGVAHDNALHPLEIGRDGVRVSTTPAKSRGHVVTRGNGSKRGRS
jgi:circadian clock protein KaiC